MNIEQLREYDKLKDDIRKDVEKDIISKVKVNDSYFYAELIVSKVGPSMDNPFTERYMLTAVLSLHNSEDFKTPHMSSDKKFVQGKRIVLTEPLDLDDIEDSTNPHILMPIFYEMLSKRLAQEMINELGKNWHQYLYNPYQSNLRMKG